MALLNPFGRSGPASVMGDGIVLRHPVTADFDAWSRLREESRGHLQPWEPTWGPDELSRAAFRRRITRYGQEIREDRGYPYFVFTPSGRLIGGCNLSNLRRGVSQTATMGYWMGVDFAGKGHMTAAVRALLGHAFSAMGLHRIEAACLPHNDASRRVLLKAGFTEEGFAREYLKIDGAWRDHTLFAILERDWRLSRTG